MVIIPKIILDLMVSSAAQNDPYAFDLNSKSPADPYAFNLDAPIKSKANKANPYDFDD